MVVIRLARTGSKKNPFYHMVIADKRRARDGRYIEKVGYFNPMARGQAVRLEMDKERIEHWLKQGAVPSERANHLIREFTKQAATEAPAEAKPTRAEARLAQSEASIAAAKKKMKAEAKTEEEAKPEVKAEETEAAAEEKAKTEE